MRLKVESVMQLTNLWHTILPLILRTAIIKNAVFIVPMNTVKIEAGDLQQLRNRVSEITFNKSLN